MSKNEHRSCLHHMNDSQRSQGMSNSTQIIAFMGLARSGKTTAANAIKNFLDSHKDEHFIVPTILSYANPIKDAMRELGIDKKNQPETYRE